MTTLPTYTAKEEAISMFSDQHKDAYGFRPRNYNWDAWTEEEIYAEIDKLQVVIEQNMKEEELQLQADLADFSALIDRTIEMGAGDRETALRWLYDGSGIGEPCSSQDLEHFAWQNGILFSDEGRAVVKELIEIYGE